LPLLRNNFFLKPLFKLKDAFRKTKPIRHILKKEVLDQIPIKERYDPYRMFRPHQNKIQNTMVDVLFSNIEIFSTDSEIFHESPFFDIKVVEFCQSLESKFKLNNGESRLVLREAMRDILPNEIVNRFSKANLTYNFMNSISPEDFRNIKNEIFDLHPILENVINKNNLLHELEILKRGTMSEKVSMNIWCFYQCNIWLKENKIRCN
jgi:asparagine synthase (glutamine-hydrolysing)